MQGQGRAPHTNVAGALPMAVYSALLGLAALAGAPWWLLRLARSARYREGLGERLGRAPRPLREAVRDRRVIWVHAVSVGEVAAIARLVADLEFALNGPSTQNFSLAGIPLLRDRWQMVVSTTTRTGQALARERFGASRVFYFPLDFRWAVRAYLRALQPAMVLLAESELWPRLLHECNRESIPVAVVNARVSDRSFRRARRFRRLWAPVLRKVSRFLAQSEADAARLRSLGAPPEAVATVGNLKYDAEAPRPSALTETLRTLCGARPVVVAGSTVEGEEEQILRSFAEVRTAVPEAVLLLAPRHPERFKAVAALAEKFGALRATSLLDPVQGKAVQGKSFKLEAPVIVLDTVGDLASVYSLADVAFVGGSLVARGGHNPLEPARFGVPVIMGPSFENFRDVVASMVAADGICIIGDASELTLAVADLLRDSARARSLGKRGQTVFESAGGATARSIQLLMPLLPLGDRPASLDPFASRDSGVPAPAYEVFA